LVASWLPVKRYAGLVGREAVIIQVDKIAELHRAVGEAHDHLQLTAHGLDMLAQGSDVNVGVALHFADDQR
jgi:hypothetical protein